MELVAYRVTKQVTTGQNSNMLIVGWEINFPVDLLAGNPTGEKEQDVTEYNWHL